MAKSSAQSDRIVRALEAGGLLVAVAVLYVARDVLIPIALGILVAFAMSPLVSRLRRWGLSNTSAVLVATVFLLTCVAALIVSIGSSVIGFTEKLPQYRGEFSSKVENLRASFGNVEKQLDEISEVVDKPSESGQDGEVSESGGIDAKQPPSLAERIFGKGDEQRKNDGSSPKQPLYVVDRGAIGIDVKSWAGGASSVLGPIGTAGLVVVFAIFGLLYREDLRDRVVSLISQGNYVVTTEALDEASSRIGRYLIAQLIVNASYGVVFALGLMLIGYFLAPDGWFPYVALLGTIAGIVRFIPYLGPIVGAALPLTLSFLLFPGFQVMLAVGGLIIVLELLSNNVMEPWIYGSSTGVSPMAIILAAVFWGWLWGPIGLLLATPLTVCAVVLGQYVPRFKFFATLLSDEMQIKPSVRAYQRLLTGDQQRINDFLGSETKGQSPARVIDKLITPTVKLIENDEEERSLSSEQLLMSLDEAVRESSSLANNDSEACEGEEAAESQTISTLEVTMVPVRNIGEEIVLKLVVAELARSLSAHVFENDDLPDRDAQRLADANPDIIVIAVIPPGGLEQSRYWCSALRKAGYRGEIMVACLGKFKHYDLLLMKFRKYGANQLVTSGAQLIHKLQRLASRTLKTEEGCMPECASVEVEVVTSPEDAMTE